ncbi:MAG: site-2 protease family protein [Chloroflexota bacterium]|nr:site-2 protease family protein [Chloroflexota bacterium]
MSETTHVKLAFDATAITQKVKALFEIESMMLGGSKQGYRLRYDGKLKLADSELAYDQLAESIKPYGLTPLFQENEHNQKILIVNQPPEPKLGPLWVNILLFLLTILSVMFTGAQFSATDVTDPFKLPLMDFMRYVLGGWPFAVSLLGILLAHELGHYLVGRSRGEKVTLPYFIPLPLSAFGTMGAFISMKTIPKNKKHLMDIGIAGPLIGLLVAVPVLFIGLSLSTVGPVEADLPEGYIHFLEGNSIFYLLAKYISFGKLLPQPASYGDLSPVLYWLRYFFTGSPAPLGGIDVQIHPVAWAGWAGLFVTVINLIPAGQLDGGHILYVLLGKERAKRIFPFILITLVVLGFFWSGWWLWAFLIFFIGRRYAEPLDQITPIDRNRKILGILALIVFVLLFMPVPLVIVQ